MGNIFADIGGALIGLATGWLKQQGDLAEAKLKAKVIKIESQARIEEARVQAYINLAANAQDHENAWERIAVEQASTSWKDEWWTILLSVPIIGAFVPGIQPYVLAGFANLEMAPDWYLAAVGIAVAFAFGFRKLVPLMTNSRKPKTSPAPTENL